MVTGGTRRMGCHHLGLKLPTRNLQHHQMGATPGTTMVTTTIGILRAEIPTTGHDHDRQRTLVRNQRRMTRIPSAGTPIALDQRR
jgi:hypothetical protein